MVARMTISIPDGLKGRIDGAKDQANWSAVACVAFERVLGEIAAKKEQKDMTDVVQRLRASRLDTDSELGQQGLVDGERWARDRAAYVQLKRLAEYEATFDQREWGNVVWETFEASATPGERFFVATHFPPSTAAEVDLPIDEAKDFWGIILGDDVSAADDPIYVRHFAEGALQVWTEVEDQL